MEGLALPGVLGAKKTHMLGGGMYYKRCVDYGATVVKMLENRLWQRDRRDVPIIQPDSTYFNEVPPPAGMVESPVNAVTTKFVRASANKVRCPIFCTSWVPDGRRLITGAASGEFTLWNGITFNFESILQGHDCPVRSMTWDHNGLWMVTTDDRGFVKYWQSNLNNVHTFQAHTDPVRCSSVSPMDTKLATCSDDGTVRIFDFYRCSEEFILRGHGADVKCVDWHPRKDLLVSGSKDNQQPVKLWDPKAGQSLTTLHAHKAAVQSVQWNKNGNWLLTAARDGLIKVYDIRNMKEMYTLKGHKKEVNTLAWHPVHETLFASGGSEGAILFWMVGNDHEVGGMESAHDSFIWSLSWHPLGHILVSGANDHTSKFWCRNRPGEEIKDRYNSAVSALLAEDTTEDIAGIGGGLSQTGGVNNAITLPPPSWSGSNQAASRTGPMVGGADDNTGSNVKVEVPVLGADIIAETFGSLVGNKPSPQPHQTFPSQPSPFPPESPGTRFPAFRPFDDISTPLSSAGSGGPHPDHDLRGPPPPQHGPPNPNRPLMQGPPPPDQFRHPPQREWPERGRPHPGEFNRPNSSPFSWQRSDYTPDRRSSFEGERRPFPPHEPPHNPYVYRRPEADRDPRDPRDHSRMMATGDPRRAAQEQRRQEWQGGERIPPPNAPPPPGRQQWEGGRPPPMRPQDDTFDRHDDFPRDQFDHRRFPPDRHGPDFGPPPHGPDRGPPQRPDHGPPQRPDHGPPQRPDHGPPQRPDCGPPQRPDHGPIQRSDLGPPQRPDLGPPQRPDHGPPQRPDLGLDRGPPHGPPGRPLQGQHKGPLRGPDHRPSQDQNQGPPPNWSSMDRPPPHQQQQKQFRPEHSALQDPRSQMHSQEPPRPPPTSQPGPQRGPPMHRPTSGGPPQGQMGPMSDAQQRREQFPPQQQRPPPNEDPRGQPRFNEEFDRPPTNQPPPSKQFFQGHGGGPHALPPHSRGAPIQQQQPPQPRFQGPGGARGPRDFGGPPRTELRMRGPPPNQQSRFPMSDRQRPQTPPGQFPPHHRPPFQSQDPRFQGDQQFGGPNQPPQGGHYQPQNEQGGMQHPPSVDPRMQRPPPGRPQQEQQRGDAHPQHDFPPHGEHFENRGPPPHHIQSQQGADGNWGPPHSGMPPGGQFRDDGDRYEQPSRDPRDRGRRDMRRERSPPRPRRMSNERDGPPAKRSRNEKRDIKDDRGRPPRSKRD